MAKKKVIYRKGRKFTPKNKIELTEAQQHRLCRINLELIRRQKDEAAEKETA